MNFQRPTLGSGGFTSLLKIGVSAFDRFSEGLVNSLVKLVIVCRLFLCLLHY